jgi:uncharacterized protein (DUF1501 family)
MLKLVDARHSRRAFLSAGSLALGGLTLPGLLAARAGAAQSGGSPLKDKSVVFLFLHGGPPQAETFDPKMTAPRGIRSVTGEIPTTLPGVTFGATLEKLAKVAHRLAVVRSFQTGDGNHDLKPLVGRDTLGANLGSIYARVAGTSHPHSGLPRNVALYPRAVDPEAQPATMAFGNFGATGPFSPAFTPFVPGSGGSLQGDLRLNVERERLETRRGLLERLDRMRRELDAAGALQGLDRFQEQAFDTILRGAADAFDLSDEDPRTIERYDTSALIAPEKISKEWNNHRNYLDNVRSLGKLMLLARRLCERGCGFVTVTTNFVWDFHADQNNATVEEGMRYVGAPFDHAVSAFIEDVDARRLSDQILLVACGEMGRTPKVNQKGGRDHWGGLAPLLLAGGGLRMGQVIGASTRDGGEPASEPVTPKDLVATVLHTLFDVGELRVERSLPSEVGRLIDAGKPIPGLL